ncbi:MAG: hypothetical protein JW984_15065 [Deltaproteobacteria bacterium]|uniref:Uncharacterized protein n=1 Tax=Candidatus Zymogenus saltonus TaxID=2844893 RepID=A0A9D8KIP4_9DELT|nr:hypothetical protein [Candidatus Zymogenus saltonus]
MISRREEEKILNAFRDAIDDYGRDRVAYEISREGREKAYSTLSQELDANYSAKFGLVDAIRSTLIIKNLGPWHEVALALGCIFVRMPEVTDGSENMKIVYDEIKESAAWIKLAAESLEDGNLDDREFEELIRQGVKMQANIERLKQIRAESEKDKKSKKREAV